MTDTIDVAALVERAMPAPDCYSDGYHISSRPFDHNGLEAQPLFTWLKVATALQSLSAELAEAKRDLATKEHMWLYECEKHAEWLEKFMAEKTRTTTAEASLATMREALEEIAHSAETHSHVIVIARAALAKEGK